MAMNSHRNLGMVGNQQRNAAQRLSSGFRINSGADDAAGLAISEGMRAQIRGMNQASRNAQDGISLIQTSEGYMQTITELGQRMRTLSLQAANDTNSDEQRAFIAAEMGQLQSEIERIWDTATFNGQLVFGEGSEPGVSNSGLVQEAWQYVRDAINDVATGLLNHANTIANAVQSAEARLETVVDRMTAINNLHAQFTDAAFGGRMADIISDVMIELGSLATIADINTAINTALQAELGAGTAGGTGANTPLPTVAFADVAAITTFLTTPAANLTALNGVRDALIAREGLVTTGAGAGVAITTWTGLEAAQTGAAADLTAAGAALATAHTNVTTSRAAIQTWLDHNDRPEFLEDATVDNVVNVFNGLGAGQSLPGADAGVLRGDFFLQVGPDGSAPGEGHSLQVSGDGGQLGDVIGNVSNRIEIIRDALGGDRGEFLPEEDMNLTDHQTFSAFSAQLDTFMNDINAMRAGLGAIENRLEFTIDNLDIAAENLSAAESRIRDADMAQEMMRMTQANVLQQAATAMLAQANQAPQSVLQLLG